MEFQHVAAFDKINLIGSTRKFAGIQRGLPPPPPLFFFFFPFTVRLSKQTPKIRVSAHRHKEIYSLPSLCNFAIPRNCYWWHNKFLSPALRTSISALQPLYPVHPVYVSPRRSSYSSRKASFFSSLLLVSSRRLLRRTWFSPAKYKFVRECLKKEEEEEERGRNARGTRRGNANARSDPVNHLSASFVPRAQRQNLSSVGLFARLVRRIVNPVPYVSLSSPFSFPCWETTGRLWICGLPGTRFSSIINRLLRFWLSCCYSEKREETEKRSGTDEFR